MIVNFIWSGLFWGIILVLFGLSVILKSVLNIDIPIFKIVFALILIYLGIKMLTGPSHKSKDTVIFDKGRININLAKDEYNVVFGSGIIDLRDLKDLPKNMSKEINIVFGSGRIYLPENIPVKLKVDTVFGESRLPDGKTEFFGEYRYQKGENFTDDTLFLEINVVFGSVVVED
ncbi:hypothetical protein ACFLYK_00830 [Candidatus Cloacimonadota bacterium]